MRSPIWGNFFALVLLLILVFGGVFLAPLVQILPVGDFGKQMALTALVYGLPLVLFFLLVHEKPKTALLLHWPGKLNLFLALLCGITIQPLMMIVSALSTLAFPNQVTEAIASYTDKPLWQMLLFVAVLPAVLEELYFRGLILGSYRGVEFFRAALASALLFAISHLDGQQFFYAFLMGLLFAYFTCRTHSVLPSMVTHFTINATQSVLAYVVFSSPLGAEMDVEGTLSIGEIGLSLLQTLPMTVLFFGFLFLFAYHNGPKDIIETEEALDYAPTDGGRRLIDVFYCLCVLIFIIMMFLEY